MPVAPVTRAERRLAMRHHPAVSLDLFGGLACRGAGVAVVGAVPLRSPLDGLLEIEQWLPVEAVLRLVRVQPQITSLLRRVWIRLDSQFACTPGCDKTFGDVADGDSVGLAGAEVPGFGEFAVVVKALGQTQVSADGFQHVLPGPDRVGTANHDGLIRGDAAHDVRHQAILGPVASPDHVAGAGSGHRGGTFAAKERVPIRRADELRAGLTGAIRIATAERVFLTISPEPLAVFVTLVAGHHHDGANRWTRADGIEHMRGA